MDSQQLNDLRTRVLKGEPVSREDLAAGIATLRQGRVSAMSTAKNSKATKKTGEAAVAEMDDILGTLGL
jgi:hypothetical protein